MILEYHRPETIPAALTLLARPNPRTLPLGGGSILSQPSQESYAVVDLQQLGLQEINLQGQTLEIGATVTLQKLMETNIIHPNLVDVIRVEAAANMRQVATVAGTLVALDGRTPFGTSFLGLDARLTVQPGDEKISLGDLLPQRAEWLKGRLITQVDIPINVALAYESVARTPADWPLVCVAVVRWPGGRTRVALGGFGRAPILAFDGPETGGVEAAVKDAYSHAGDQWASAAYRKEMVATLTARALLKINESQVNRMMPDHDFSLLDEQDLPEINSQGHHYRHRRTGAELLSIANDDQNKVFGVTFRTPPPGSNGLPHIMEHSVLCGSRKYPVKEPFVWLRKGSLTTFLNAYTFPDKTVYPLASQNLQDFYNLIDVYLDAVFFPLLLPHILEQEGWHYEPDPDGDGLIYKGVVFNEMKGNYSNPENILATKIRETLFPDTSYRFDYAGDPQEIPNLDYKKFRSYHNTYYHPSNARFFFYGDDPLENRFKILSDYLKEFSSRKIDSQIALQTPRSSPESFTFPFAVSEIEKGDEKFMVAVNWLLPENGDPLNNIAFRILNHILVGSPASPLRQVLINSGLGEDLTGRGLADSQRQLTFSVGLKGVAEGNTEQVEELVLSSLRELAHDGIDSEMVAAALNTVEFQLREQNTGSFPRGLFLMLIGMNAWLYGGGPLQALAFNKPFQEIKARLERGERFFEDLIAANIVDNPHRTTVILKPDATLLAEWDRSEKEKLTKVKDNLTTADYENLVARAARLKQIQETPDTPEALAAIPALELEDLERENKQVPIHVEQLGGTETIFHDLFTNGILYLDLGLNLTSLPQDLLPYTDLFGRALTDMGTEEEDFIRLSQRIGRETGGVWTTSLVSATRDAHAGAAWLMLRGKATVDQAQSLLEIFRDILTGLRLDDRERFRQIVLEAKAGLEARLIPGGHGMVNRRLRARFNIADWAAEQIRGISYLDFLRRLVERIESDWSSVKDDLLRVQGILINRKGIVCNATLDASNWGEIRPAVAAFIKSLPEKPFVEQVWNPTSYPLNEGMSISAQVNYVGKGANLYALGYELDGSINVILNHLRTSWLWEKVRVQGGAYGGMCAFDRHSGVFTFLSYRDPNLLTTLENFDGTADYLRGEKINQDELTRSIIGAIGALDAYRLPDAQGYISMVRHLLRDTEDNRQRLREEILATTPVDFLNFAGILDEVSKKGQIAVLGSSEALEEANSSRSDFLKIRKIL